jgi:hypothetical protein
MNDFMLMRLTLTLKDECGDLERSAELEIPMNGSAYLTTIWSIYGPYSGSESNSTHFMRKPEVL